jgi:hypothetical protein
MPTRIANLTEDLCHFAAKKVTSGRYERQRGRAGRVADFGALFRLVAENPTWGAPRMHGEPLKLGFPLSETTVSRWLRRTPRTPDPAKPWLALLRDNGVLGGICRRKQQCPSDGLAEIAPD